MLEIKNWKLKELDGKFEIVHDQSKDYKYSLLDKMDFPLSKNLTGLDRKETIIDWKKVANYHSFFFDGENDEDFIRRSLRASDLNEYNHLIIPYRPKEPVVKVKVEDFLKDWEGFVRSTLWETIIHTEDLNLIIEISRDYFMHSNFKIVDKPNLLRIE